MIKKTIFFLISIFSFALIWIVLFQRVNKNIVVVDDNCMYDTVEKVYDGDTVLTKKLGKVRFLWIDAPEIYHKGWTEVKEYKFFGCGEDARKFVDDMIYKKRVKICFDKTENKKWWYNRNLAYIMVKSEDGENLPLWVLLIEKWLAKTFRYADFKYKKTYLQLEKIAKEKKIWMWSEKCINEDKQFKKEHLKTN